MTDVRTRVDMQGSISPYYYTPARNVFVGLGSAAGGLSDRQQRRFAGAYRAFGPALLLAAATAGLIMWISGPGIEVFVAEAAGLVVLSAFWLIKTRELSLSRLDGRAAAGEVDARDVD